MAKTSAKPKLEVVTRTGRGRPKQPLERREILNDYPHHNRKGPPDQRMGSTLGMTTIPLDPPIEMNAWERECWNRISKRQHELRDKAWIFDTDESYLIATCGLYGRWRAAREELDRHLNENGTLMVSEDKVHPLVVVEGNLATKYHSSLAALGMVPTRRQLSYTPDSETPSDQLLK